MDDRELLVENSTPASGGVRTFVQRIYDYFPLHCLCGTYANHKRIFWFFVALICIVIGHVIAYYFIYVKCNSHNCIQLKVMSLNCWGMPASFGSLYKEERIRGIAQELAKAEFDLYLYEELWMQPDYNTVRASVPENYYMTEFRQLALSTCDGRVAPTACSGLAIVSKFPFKEIEFNSYTEHGNFWRSGIDGEWFARKGVGRVRIQPMENITVDVFITHTAADPDPSYGYDNSWYRERQVKELMDSYVLKSTADIVLLGGDFNAGPEMKNGAPYSMVRKHMTNSIEEIFYKLDEWLDKKFATYGNLQNTFTAEKYTPIIYDYIFYKTKSTKATAYTNWFELPLFKLKIFESLKPKNETQASSKLERTATNATSTAAETTSSPTEESSRMKRETADETVELVDRAVEAIDKAVEAAGEAVGRSKIISFSDHEAVTSTIYIQH